MSSDTRAFCLCTSLFLKQCLSGIGAKQKPTGRWDITGDEYMMRHLYAFALMAVCLAFAMAGCQKEGCTDSKASNYAPDAKKDNGTCVYTTPEPEPTPVIPTKEITLNWTWDDFNNRDIVNKDTIKKYTDMEDVKFVFLNLVNEDNGAACSTFMVMVFHMIYEDLQPRFDISNKVRGSGTFFVDEMNGAQLPDSASYWSGMAASDSTKFANWGYQIKRYQGTGNSK